MTTTQLQATLELRDNLTPTLRRAAEQIEVVTDKPKGRLLQVGDLVDYHGRRGTVSGIDLQEQDTELGPMFLIELEDGGEIFARTCACRVLERAAS